MLRFSDYAMIMLYKLCIVVHFLLATDEWLGWSDHASRLHELDRLIGGKGDVLIYYLPYWNFTWFQEVNEINKYILKFSISRNITTN